MTHSTNTTEKGAQPVSVNDARNRVSPFAIAVFLVVASLSILIGCGSDGEALRINGSTTVNPPVAEAAEILRTERRIEIRVDTQGGSSGGIARVADGLADIGMSSKPLAETDRAKYLGVDFRSKKIGADAVALVVSKDVWDAGLRALSREDVRKIYEGEVDDWSAFDLPEQKIAFFDKEPGRGTWEVFATWLYGDSSAAPTVDFPEVGGNEETRNKVATTPGAISQLSMSWADGESVFALGIYDDEEGSVIECTPENVEAGIYPMTRSLLLITRGDAEGNVKMFLDFMLGERGQELVRKHGYLALADLGEGE